MRNLFSFMLSSPCKNRPSVFEEILDFSTCIDFICTSLTCMCILVKILQKVMETVTRDRLKINSDLENKISQFQNQMFM